MKLNVEIECPYCNKIHVHRIDIQSEVKPKIEEDDAKPVDPETEDLDKFRGSEEDGDDLEVP